MALQVFAVEGARPQKTLRFTSRKPRSRAELDGKKAQPP
jgi:hypothetical protein